MWMVVAHTVHLPGERGAFWWRVGQEHGWGLDQTMKLEPYRTNSVCSYLPRLRPPLEVPVPAQVWIVLSGAKEQMKHIAN